MLQAKKEALENSIRQRLVAVRERELHYYFDNARIMGTTSAVLSGLSYSGIRYHYLLVRNSDWDDTYELAQHSIEEMVFLAMLTITMGLNLQLLFICMLVALLGPQLALRGPDGSLHDAVEGMHSWNTVIMAFFMLSVFLLELCVFSFTYGHNQLNVVGRVILISSDSLLIFATVRYARMIMRRLALPKEQRVSGAFFAHQKGDPISSFQGLEHEGFHDDPVHANGLSSARIPTRAAPSATRIAGDEALPLTAESLDHSVNEFLSGHALASIPVHRPLVEAPAPEPPAPSAASCVAAAGWGVFPSVREPRGHESEEEDEEMPLNGRPRNRPAVRISKKPRRAHSARRCSTWACRRRKSTRHPPSPGARSCDCYATPSSRRRTSRRACKLATALDGRNLSASKSRRKQSSNCCGRGRGCGPKSGGGDSRLVCAPNPEERIVQYLRPCSFGSITESKIRW